MDIDSSVGPTRTMTEPAFTGATPPEVIILGGEVPLGPGRHAASSSSAPPAAPEAPVEKVVEKTSDVPATAQRDEPAASASIPVGAPIESAIIGGLKESLVKASQFDLRLR